jgi:hypothetical protein
MPGGNDAIFVNPAAMGARRRYSLEASYLGDRRAGDPTLQYFGSSVVDSLSGPVSAGIAYTRASRAPYQGNLFHLAVSGPIAERLFLGVTGKYYSLAPGLGLADPKVSAATLDAGLFWEPASFVAIGAAGYDLVSIGNERAAPRQVAAGLSVGSDQSVRLSGEWRGDFDRAARTTSRWSVGAEVLLGNLVPLRAGWVKDETLRADWWSVGLGLITGSGVGFDAAYRQGIQDPNARTFAVAIKYFFLEP